MRPGIPWRQNPKWIVVICEMQKYGIGEIISNVFSLMYTKLNYPGARLLRIPFYMRGKRHFKWGKGLTVGYRCRFEVYTDDNAKHIKIGRNCRIGDNVHISAADSVTIGDNCLLASNILIIDNEHGDYTGGAYDSFPDIAPNERKLVSAPIEIGDNVWIGERVIVLKGVCIGNGCVIGAGSIVRHDIPDNCIAVGSPAKVVKRFDAEQKRWQRMV